MVAVSLALDDPRWQGFVAQHPAAGPFHHPAWAALLAHTYGHRPFVLAALDPAGSLQAGLPAIEVAGPRSRRWVALPFTDDCSPLLTSAVELDAFARDLESARRAAGIARLEVRAALPGGAARPCGEALVHRLELGPDPARVWATFHRSQVQRNVQRAERDGVAVRWATSVGDVAGVFYALHLGTRWRQGVPVQPRGYFRRLARDLLGRGLGFALLAYSGERPIAGAVFLAWNGTVIYKYGASDAAYWRLRPNHLLFWTAIRWACLSGYRVFDFGRTDSDNAGLRDFKRGWGTVEAPLVYSCLGQAGGGAGRGGALDLLGRVIRRSPAWVCRGLGEVLYRYAA